MAEINRREFAEAVALAALAPFLGAGGPSLDWAALATGGGMSSPAAGLATQDPRTMAEALAAVIRVQYHDRLNEEQLATVTRQVERGLERAEQIRGAALANGDGPDFIFSAVRSDGVA